MKRFAPRRLMTTLSILGLLGTSSQVLASAFQIWEQDAANVSNYHAGYAALANDASIAWFNPAGITRFKNQQLVIGAVPIMSDFKYKGSVVVTNILPPGIPQPTGVFNNVTAQGGAFSVVPNLHYVAPISDRVGFGFSIDAPFGLKTNYGRGTPMRFAATTTSITIIDISPSIGIRVIERGDSKGSIGAGFDVQKAYAEFDNVGFSTLTTATAYSHNRANDTGYGYHLGALYEINDNGRIGLSYHSQVVHHLTGSSTFTGLIADGLNDGPLHAQRMTAKVTLPPYTALSGYYKVKPDVAVMASAIYTQWNIFKTLKLTNIAGAAPISDFPFAEPSTTIVVLVPENYRNTWNFSVGADYYATSDITLRSGIGYDETPILNAYRNAQLPDNNRFVIALGGHYQATKAVGFDFGWSHFFINQASLNPPPQVTGAQVVNLSGNVTGGADVFGGQVVWDIV